MYEVRTSWLFQILFVVEVVWFPGSSSTDCKIGICKHVKGGGQIYGYIDLKCLPSLSSLIIIIFFIIYKFLYI